MHASRVTHVSILALALAIAGHAGSAKAADVPSDRMLVTDTAGTPIFDNSIPETAAAGETTLTYAGGPTPVTPPPIPLTSALTIPGVAVLILTEPASEPPDPTEPPIILSGPAGDVHVSDVVISTLTVASTAGVPGFVSLVSDGDPELQNILPILATLNGITFMEETGQLQDLTPFVSGPAGANPVQVFVQSDVTPEPSALLLVGVGLGVLSLVRRRMAS